MREYFLLFLLSAYVSNGAVCYNASAVIDENQLLYGQPGAFTDTNFPRAPENWGAKVASHIPVLTMYLAPMVKIIVPHEMIESHWITAVWAENEKGETFACTEFNATCDGCLKSSNGLIRAGIEAYVPSSASEVKPFEHCNAHGVWQAASYLVPSDMCQKITDLKAENGPLYADWNVFSKTRWPMNSVRSAFSDKSHGAHVPTVRMYYSFRVKVNVPHEMIDTHWITAVWLEDNTGSQLQAACQEYNALNDSATLVYELPKDFGNKKVRAFEHCNKHGVWKSEDFSTPDDHCSNTAGLVAENEELYNSAGEFTNYYFPSSWETKTGSHVPTFERVNGNQWKVALRHEDTNLHWITTIWVVDQNGNVILCDDSPQSNGTHTYSFLFDIPDGTSSLVAYEHCNLHGVWQSAELRVPCVDAGALLAANTPPNTAYTLDPQDPQSIRLVPYFPENKPLFLAPIVRVISESSITSLWVQNADNTMLACKTFDPSLTCTGPSVDCTAFSTNQGVLFYAPFLDFYVPRTATTLTAYVHSNDNGAWTSSSMLIDFNACPEIMSLKEENNALHGLPAIFNETTFPDSSSGLFGNTTWKAHVPILEFFLAPMVRVKVPHEMKPTHWITSIWLEDENNSTLKCQNFDLGMEPQLDYYLPSSAMYVKGFEHCNKHGVWMSELSPINMVNYCGRIDDLIVENELLYNTPGPYWHDYYPNPLTYSENWAGKINSHVPVIEMINSKYRVTVPHEMTDTHWITAIWVVNQVNETIICEHFDPDMFFTSSKGFNTDGHPYVEFDLPLGTTSIYAFEHCNKHGVWQSCFNEAQLISQNYGLKNFAEAVPFSKTKFPAEWSDVRSAHIPKVTMWKTPLMHVLVDHEMVVEHYITSLWAYDQSGGKLICNSLDRIEFEEEDKVEIDIYLPMGTTHVTVYEHCTQHGVWKSESIPYTIPLICDSTNTNLPDLIPENFDLYKIRGAFTKEVYPAGWEAKTKSHVPEIILLEDGVTVQVTVPHEMTQLHWITAIWVEDANQNVVACMEFNEIQNGYPMVEFQLPSGISFDSLIAYEHCNKHGVWKNETISDQTPRPSNAYLLKIPLGVIFGLLGFFLL